jgi:hypothetical protein
MYEPEFILLVMVLGKPVAPFPAVFKMKRILPIHIAVIIA